MFKTGVCLFDVSCSFFFLQINASGRLKRTQNAGKSTIFEQAIPDTDNQKWTHIAVTVDLLVSGPFPLS